MIYYDMPFDEYIKLEGINASALKHGVKSTKHMRAYIEHSQDETRTMELGRVGHTAILEPALFDNESIVYDGIRRGKAWDEFQEENTGKTILKWSDMENIYGMRKGVYANRIAESTIRRTRHEVVIQWEMKHIGLCKARLDAYCQDTGLLGELKSTGDVRPSKFSRTCLNMGTHIQIGWQHIGLRALDLKISNTIIIAVEQSRPWDCVAYEPDNDFISTGADTAAEIARKYAVCKAINQYQGICDDKAILMLPEWHRNDAVESDTSEGEMEVSEL